MSVRVVSNRMLREQRQRSVADAVPEVHRLVLAEEARAVHDLRLCRSGSGAAGSGSRPGRTSRSASWIITMSPVACVEPLLDRRALAAVAAAASTTLQIASSCLLLSRMSRVPSVEQSSTTMISFSMSALLDAIEQLDDVERSLKHGMTMRASGCASATARVRQARQVDGG